MALSQQPAPRPTSWVHRVYGRLNRRLLAWFLLFSLLPVLGTNAVGYGRSATIITEIVERFLVAYARLEAQHIGDRIQERLKTLRAMAAGNETLLAGVMNASGQGSGTPAEGRSALVVSPEAVQRYLARARQEMRAFDALALFTVDGRMVAATDSLIVWGAPPAAHVRSGFAEFVQGGEDSPGTLVLRLIVPILRRDSLPVGYLVASVRRTSAAAFLQLPDYRTSGIEGIIFDAEGHSMISTMPHANVAERSSVFHPALTPSSEAVSRYYDGNGLQRIAAVSDIPQSSWFFVAEVSAEDALAPLRRLGGLSLLLEVLLAVVLIATAVVVAREIVAPVQRLAVAARRVAAGDLAVRIPVRGHDEVAELGHAFNEMTRALADATERVAEMHQREIERASQLATVGELASGLAHEIKNPVVGVANGLDLVRRRHGDDPALQPIFDEITKQLQRIESTVHDLLAFARPAAPRLGQVSTNAVVARAVLLTQPAAEQAGVRMVVHADAEDPQLQADEGMVYQALVNLLMNAMQATPADGSIRIATGVEGREVLIDIADTGKGIAAADLQQVFRPFFTTRHKGTGLGLSITRGIIERHGGTLTIESAEGVGTTVHIRLPKRIDDSAPSEATRT